MVPGFTIADASHTLGNNQYRPTNINRSMALKESFFGAVRRRCQSADGNMTVFDDWAQWALAEADRIDPMVSGRFMAGYGHRESE